uniref:Uncharacterized protein n=1 Tax=Ananas comosus var. bracteatus TaxID=296719 RepID=A0A6V7Q8R0_ANACO|nr:unnamed protein product [Ananas comosus var. bracteatus]
MYEEAKPMPLCHTLVLSSFHALCNTCLISLSPMKSNELFYTKIMRRTQENTTGIVLVLIFSSVVLTIMPVYFFPLWKRSSSSSSTTATSSPLPLPSPPPSVRSATMRSGAKCDIFSGEWVPNPKAPYYTNGTCWAIHAHQNCMKFGRPDDGFMKWRWRPDGCELPVFNPAQFLELVRGKSLAFLGDSVGRNQMQSLMCLLSKVTYVVDISTTSDDKSRRWSYPTHNFTLANFWSPYLVRSVEADPKGPTLTGLFNLYLDEPDSNWTTQIKDFDYVIVSAGHWFFRPTLYHENHRTTFQTLLSLAGYKGTTFLRTYTPSHFENGEWDKGGNCLRTRPVGSNETRLEGINLEMYMTQLEEFRSAEREARARGLKFRLIDVTEVMLRRPDGHPSRYGHLPQENVTMYNDCVHWCLPGPIDSWNDFLLQMLKMEGGSRSSSGKFHGSERKLLIK